MSDLIGRYIFEERKIYHCVADFFSPIPLWKRVLRGFLSSHLSHAVLMLWSGFDVTQDNLNELNAIVSNFKFDNEKSIHLIPPINGKIFLPQLLRKSTHFITSRELINVDCLDWLYDTDVKIISALDDGIFEGESPVEWNKL